MVIRVVVRETINTGHSYVNDLSKCHQGVWKHNTDMLSEWTLCVIEGLKCRIENCRRPLGAELEHTDRQTGISTGQLVALEQGGSRLWETGGSCLYFVTLWTVRLNIEEGKGNEHWHCWAAWRAVSGQLDVQLLTKSNMNFLCCWRSVLNGILNYHRCKIFKTFKFCYVSLVIFAAVRLIIIIIIIF